MGRLLRRADARTKPTDDQLREVNADRKLVRKKRRRQRMVDRMAARGLSVKTAPQEGLGSRLFRIYAQRSLQVDTLRKTLYNSRLSRAIHDSHASRDREEIERRLNETRPCEFLAPKDIHYQLPARVRKAEDGSAGGKAAAAADRHKQARSRKQAPAKEPVRPAGGRARRARPNGDPSRKRTRPRRLRTTRPSHAQET